MTFETQFSLESRKTCADALLKQRKGFIPVIIQPYPRCTVKMSKTKFLVSQDHTFSSLIYNIRSEYMKNLRNPETIYFFVNGTILVQPFVLLGQLYEKHKNEDGFLYIYYNIENSFGCLS